MPKNPRAEARVPAAAVAEGPAEAEATVRSRRRWSRDVIPGWLGDPNVGVKVKVKGGDQQGTYGFPSPKLTGSLKIDGWFRCISY